MTAQLSAPANAYVQAINKHDAAAFRSLFTNDAVVDDAGREFRGLDAIKDWSDREIFAADVTLDVIDETERDGEAVITTKVDGNFDRTGLPDPVIITHRIARAGDKIAALTCRLADQVS
jgi:ketosteroid isomerase-like protein